MKFMAMMVLGLTLLISSSALAEQRGHGRIDLEFLGTDVDCDGWDDRVSFDLRTSQWIAEYGRRRGGFSRPEVFVAWSGHVRWLYPMVGDVTGDGCADVIGMADDGLNTAGGWWVTEGGNRDTHAWGAWALENAFGRVRWSNVHLRDVNRDGLLDIVGTATTRGGTETWAAESDGYSFYNYRLRGR